MNFIAYQCPDRVYYSDSYPFGLGGFSIAGPAWPLIQPTELHFRVSNNLLEHIAAIILLWIDIINGLLCTKDCFLLMTDSLTSQGWAQRTNFSELGNNLIQAMIQLEIAHSHAKQVMETGLRDYSQWFPGVENVVADVISWDDNLLDDKLTHVLTSLNLPQKNRLIADLASSAAACETAVT